MTRDEYVQKLAGLTLKMVRAACVESGDPLQEAEVDLIQGVTDALGGVGDYSALVERLTQLESKVNLLEAGRPRGL